MIKFKHDEVYHCKNVEIAIELLRHANDQGYKWNSGDSYIGRCDWSVYSEDTCYDILSGEFADLSYFKYKTEYTVIDTVTILNYPLTDIHYNWMMHIYKSNWYERLAWSEQNLLSDIVSSRSYNFANRDTLNNIRRMWIDQIIFNNRVV